MAFLRVAENRLNVPKQLALLGLGLGLWAFIVYIRWIATPEALLFITASQLDKLAHLSGGIFLALAAEWRFSRAPLAAFLAAVFTLTVGWEALEFFFDSGTRFFYANAPDLWRLDSSGDIVAAYLGGYGYWVFLMNRNGSSTKRQHGSNADRIRV